MAHHTTGHHDITGRTVAFLATDGVEQIELTKPWEAVQQAGGKPQLLSIKNEAIQGVNHLDKGDTFPVDRLAGEASAEDYDALVIPGGVANPDRMREDQGAVGFVRMFAQSGKPIGSICHGPWMLIEADVVRGRTLTSWPSLKTDIRNAGGTWLDAEVHVDKGIVTSRKPDDLDAFCDKLLEEIAEGRHERQLTGAVSASV